MKAIKESMKQWSKSKVVLLLAVILALVILLFTGCAPCADGSNKVTTASHKLYARYGEDANRFICTITIDTIQGHEYIVAEEANGLCIIHAASCSCSKHVPAATEEEETTFDW